MSRQKFTASGERGAGEDLQSRARRRFLRLQAETGIQGVGQLPGQHVAAVPVHDRHQVHETTRHRHVMDRHPPTAEKRRITLSSSCPGSSNYRRSLTDSCELPEEALAAGVYQIGDGHALGVGVEGEVRALQILRREVEATEDPHPDTGAGGGVDLDVAVQVVATGVRGPLEADECGEMPGLVVSLRGLGDA